MPFLYHKTEIKGATRDFETLNEIITQEIVPAVNWKPWLVILPNGCPSLYLNETGSVLSHNPKEYFALACMRKGLHLADVGLWLDVVLDRHEHVYAENESILRFDRRKPIYFFGGTGRRNLIRLEPGSNT